jgi:uncharacterized protein YjiS (DUF1127 family)
MGGVKHCRCYRAREVAILATSEDAGPIKVADVKRTSGKGIIMNVARSLNNWRKYRQTVTELGRMTNRELSDLGIDRGDIRNVARASIAR